MFIILVLLAYYVLMIAIPIGLTILINKWLKKRIDKRLAKTIALIPSLIMIFVFFKACHSNDNFSEITTIDFPKLGIVKHKRASFPDHHGDYTSCSLIELGNSDYKMLLNTIVDLGFEEQENKFNSEVHKIILRKLKDRKVGHESVSEKGGAYHMIQFLSDIKSIIALRISW